MTDEVPVPEELPRPPRRKRYRGTHPRHFSEKYKEHESTAHPDTVAKVLASGKTPAGMHRPIMVPEVLEALALQPGDVVADCTLGYGGHTQEFLKRVLPGGRIISLDVDPIEIQKTEARLRAAGFGPDCFVAVRSNFAGLPQALARAGFEGVNAIFADLGVSSMQIDNPDRGFSFKVEGPLDMRMNPQRGQPASHVLARVAPETLAAWLRENDEPNAAVLSTLAGGECCSTTELANAIRRLLPERSEQRELSVRRFFQALRIAVNDEFSALEALLRVVPDCLLPGGRVAVLTFHSGEDRRVKKSFADGLAAGVYEKISREVIRPGAEERRDNPRSSSAKLRWALKSTESA